MVMLLSLLAGSWVLLWLFKKKNLNALGLQFLVAKTTGPVSTTSSLVSYVFPLAIMPLLTFWYVKHFFTKRHDLTAEAQTVVAKPS
ncbi:MAG: hypothetical protein ACOYXT_01420 [Bacteroidota bacterium]